MDQDKIRNIFIILDILVPALELAVPGMFRNHNEETICPVAWSLVILIIIRCFNRNSSSHGVMALCQGCLASAISRESYL